MIKWQVVYVWLGKWWSCFFPCFSQRTKHLRAAPTQTRRAASHALFLCLTISSFQAGNLWKAASKSNRFGLNMLEQTVEQLPPSRFTLEKCLRWDFIQVCCLNQLQHEYKLIIWQTVYALRRYMMLFLSLSLVVGMYSSLALPITLS